MSGARRAEVVRGAAEGAGPDMYFVGEIGGQGFEDGRRVTHSAGIPANMAREGC